MTEYIYTLFWPRRCPSLFLTFNVRFNYKFKFQTDCKLLTEAKTNDIYFAIYVEITTTSNNLDD